ncbi:Carboxymuconolactone decarboxylase family protein [Sulfidibacter corallicola]|uniref:Carboxymuconolactone decarboxylase family protein n=1 Tax=Sulfidibacter corallicola TaxID=2818388 RepID=A0A8A4TXS9_SULCO|nr:carboxymuconolactone decarboxylase family protein [Sulfidibacter corallicola]QTD51335.1 carboxymuconolactone decarboxylase family protein [Sulfidibacter corallicola]
MDRIPKTYQKFSDRYPDIIGAYDRLNESVKGLDALSADEIALVKLGISIGAGMDGAMASQTRKAIKSGVAPEKIEQTAVLALPTLGLPRMMQAFKTITGVLERRDRETE